jgi:ABC-2 type transport system ATP-binding protein
MSNCVLELSHVTKRYGSFTAVDDISFAIPAGSIYGFLGPNGAGKTTTIRIILDILKPDSGSISILGSSSAMAVRHRIGYLPEEKGLYKKMKVWAIISYFATLKGLDRKSAKRRSFELLETYGLRDFADARVESLSKGMGQKVQVLSAVAHNPELVILDEPFSGLDPVNQEVLEQLIRDIASQGHTVIFSTHIMQHAERLCDRLLLISKGRKVFDGTVPEACAILPRRVLVESSDDLALIRELEGVLNVSVQAHSQTISAAAHDLPLQRLWEIQLQENTDPRIILHKCFERGIALTRFDYTPPSLHDVFVHLVGTDAREHYFR